MNLPRLLRAGFGPIDKLDPDGVDPALIAELAVPFDRLCKAWFGLEVQGIDNLPDGKALIVGNHNSGSMFLEAVGVSARCALEHPDQPWHGLAHDVIIGLPWMGKVLHRLGALRASHESADAAFAKGRKVLVFPGGNREAYRPWSRRYKVELGDRRGFVKLAITHGVPIVPVVFVGGHSGFVVLDDGRKLARFLRADRWLRSDTWPLIADFPFGLMWGPGMHVPLPVKCVSRFLEPIPTDIYEGNLDDAIVEEVFQKVVGPMQAAMDEIAAVRRQAPWPLRR